MADRPALEDGTTELVISPEMIEAGVKAYAAYLEDGWSVQQLVQRVFQAMHEAQPRP